MSMLHPQKVKCQVSFPAGYCVLEGGVKGKYDIRVTECMREKCSQFIEESSVLHGTILYQTDKNFWFKCCTSTKTVKTEYVPTFGT
jgi:hypothetical protein